MTFEESASFLRCEERTLDSVSEGYGGAVFNSAKGSIVFKGNLTMVENDAKVGARRKGSDWPPSDRNRFVRTCPQPAFRSGRRRKGGRRVYGGGWNKRMRRAS